MRHVHNKDATVYGVVLVSISITYSILVIKNDTVTSLAYLAVLVL